MKQEKREMNSYRDYISVNNELKEIADKEKASKADVIRAFIQQGIKNYRKNE